MSDPAARLAELRRRFIERSRARRSDLARAAAEEDAAELRIVAHGFAGSGAIFGFRDVSDAGAALEQAVDAGTGWEELRRLIALLLERLDAMEVGQ